MHYNLIGRFDTESDNFAKQSTLLDLKLIDPEDYEITDNLLLEAPYFENPEVSIIIPAYNQENYTLACIESIIRNTKDITYEIIVADDKSPDIEARELNRYFKNIVFTSNEKNMGFLMNCKSAVKLSRGKYLHFLNNDTNKIYFIYCFTTKNNFVFCLEAISKKILRQTAKILRQANFKGIFK